jgi:hypothetical protein
MLRVDSRGWFEEAIQACEQNWLWNEIRGGCGHDEMLERHTRPHEVETNLSSLRASKQFTTRPLASTLRDL